MKSLFNKLNKKPNKRSKSKVESEFDEQNNIVSLTEPKEKNKRQSKLV
jgi:hypothetical protein